MSNKRWNLNKEKCKNNQLTFKKKFLEAQVATAERQREITDYRKEVFTHVQEQHGDPFGGEEFDDDYEDDE